MSQTTVQSLRFDHIELNLLFGLYEGAAHYSQQQAIVRRLCTELEAQAIAQEELFYPAVQHNMGQEGAAFVTEGMRRQQAIKLFLRRLRNGGLSPQEFAAAVAELKHWVTQRIHTEQDIFPAILTQFGFASEGLGGQIQQRKRQLMALANRPEVESLRQVPKAKEVEGRSRPVPGFRSQDSKPPELRAVSDSELPSTPDSGTVLASGRFYA